MILTVLLVIYIAVFLVGTILSWVRFKSAADPEWKHPIRVAIPTLILVIMEAFPVIGALLPDGPLCWFFQRWGNVFLGYLLFFLGILLILTICLALFKGLFSAKNQEKRKPARAVSIVILVISLAVSAAVNVCGYGTARDVKVTKYEMDKELLGLDEPLRIVLISDLHIGVNSGTALYRDMVDRINEQDADLVLVAGDLITSSYGAMKDPEAYASILREIQSKYGTYAVYGNHDVDEPLLGGFTYIDKEKALRNPAMESWVRSCGFELLEDEVVEIPGLEGVALAGRRDEAKPGDLQHEATDLRRLEENGVAMSLSGHTHDGQIFPGNIYCRIFTQQSYGLKDWGASKSIVSSGVGYYGPPIRVGTISEIVVIDLE